MIMDDTLTKSAQFDLVSILSQSDQLQCMTKYIKEACPDPPTNKQGSTLWIKLFYELYSCLLSELSI